ncbi:MAG: adenylyltransferase/cytidyltransferase family protein [Candidatus Peregrinibacteria bacterium]
MIFVPAEAERNIRNAAVHKVLVFGSFDILHPGHTEFLKDAKKLGTHLTVVLARDSSIQKIKGRSPHFLENERVAQLQALKFVDEVILGDEHDYFRIPYERQPEIIALGYDQLVPEGVGRGVLQYAPTAENKNLITLQSLLPHTKIVRLTPHHPEQFKSSLLRNL